jgi:lipopolysaccharide transport system ATP-binding protein
MAAGQDVLIRLAGVGKRYPSLDGGGGRLRTLWSLLRGRGLPAGFDALSDISLQVARGQSLGLIGENGAGKSTLMKVIAGVVRPSAGVLETRGTIGALLELGAGFHPEYSGRDNVFLSASLMGLSRPEIQDRLDEIIAFADIGEHIDQPIKHYSSGMVVRLGFAVATTLCPDILITDEVLAVGDESFQKKCIAWMENYLEHGGTLILCSHSMFHIQKLCRQAAWIHHGRLEMYGDAVDVSHAYLAYHEARGRRAETPVAAAAGYYEVRSLCLNGGAPGAPASMSLGASLRVHGTLHSPDGRVPTVAIGLVRADGTPVYGLVSDMDGYQPSALDAHTFAFAIDFPDLPLLPGRYFVRAHAMDPEGLRLFDHAECQLHLSGNTSELGFCRLAHRWDGAAGGL